ncbi:unnamed protein product [Nippostrongylus brasiliensis]|uniref:Ephrin RBD domain-containing protein n=1 Tax=Nippostrongylus brasiliensis TaxID=27835 RepID=A0A0N4Y3P7_NIPBR|nr:unnamed protein product [Nippostrongylus brasiliensis]
MERYVSIGDAVDIICPYYDSDVDFSDTEQSIIYRVPESDYETCTLSLAARELGRCISPMRRDKVKVSFRLLSPNPSALDYLPGQSYYFISTSTGSPWGLDNTRGGLCSTNQLKMIIHVGAIGHHHRHHRKPVTTTPVVPTRPPAAMEESDWPADPLWSQFFDKVESVGNSVWSTVTRGERLSLDGGSRRHEYESVPFHDEMDFQIHEIGEVESLFSSATTTMPISFFFLTIFLLQRVDDFIYEARAVKARPPPHQPFATRLKRDMTMDRYLAHRISREAPVSDDPTELYPRVEFSLNKKKRWEQVRALQESISKDNTGSKALVTFCTPYRGSLWWYRTLGVVNLNKMNDRLLSDAAVKGKAKNIQSVVFGFCTQAKITLRKML